VSTSGAGGGRAGRASGSRDLRSGGPGRWPEPAAAAPDARRKIGHYRAEARDTPIADEKGESRISVGDYAAAVIDTLENESFIRARFTVAY
jgi:hypothetical protein